MKVAVIGSRGLSVENIGELVPEETTEIISGGAKGIDTCAAIYAERQGIKFTEIKPDYSRYKKGAPIVRNREIVRLADCVVIIWDGKSRGTKCVIDECEKTGKEYKLYVI